MYDTRLSERHDSVYKTSLVEFQKSSLEATDGIGFDARGRIHIQGTDKSLPGVSRPKSINVARTFQQIHVLHAATDTRDLSEPKTHLADYVLEYDDGTEHVIKVNNREHIADWSYMRSNPWETSENERMGAVWTSDYPILSNTPYPVEFWTRLFRTTWKNPNPEKRVAAIHLEATHSSAGVVIVAITTE